MSFTSPPSAALPQLPNAPAPPPLFGAQPAGQKPKRQSFFPTFLGSGETPSPGQLGQKSLLGGGAS